MYAFRFAVLAFAALALGAGARAADIATVNVLVIPADSSAQVYYAQDLGYFKAANLDVHISSMASSPAIISALVSGSAEIGNSVVGSAVAARLHGIAVRFVAPAGLYVSATPTSRLMATKDSPLRTAADFSGKTIAVTGLADLTYYAAKAWLDQSGGNAGAVKFVELPVPAMVPALTEHRVDGAVLIEPFIAAEESDLRPVANVDDFVAKRFLATGWLASDAWLSAHAEVAQRFAAVMLQTAQWANAHHDESAKILLRYTKLTPETTAKMMRATYGTTLDASLMQPVIENALHYGDLKGTVSPNELMWPPPAGDR